MTTTPGRSPTSEAKCPACEDTGLTWQCKKCNGTGRLPASEPIEAVERELTPGERLAVENAFWASVDTVELDPDAQAALYKNRRKLYVRPDCTPPSASGFTCKDCCQSIDDCAKNGCHRSLGPPMAVVKNAPSDRSDQGVERVSEDRLLELRSRQFSRVLSTPRPTIEELEKILQREDVRVEIQPNGEVRAVADDDKTLIVSLIDAELSRLRASPARSSLMLSETDRDHGIAALTALLRDPDDKGTRRLEWLVPIRNWLLAARSDVSGDVS